MYVQVGRWASETLTAADQPLARASSVSNMLQQAVWLRLWKNPGCLARAPSGCGLGDSQNFASEVCPTRTLPASHGQDPCLPAARQPKLCAGRRRWCSYTSESSVTWKPDLCCRLGEAWKLEGSIWNHGRCCISFWIVIYHSEYTTSAKQVCFIHMLLYDICYVTCYIHICKYYLCCYKIGYYIMVYYIVI